MTTQVPAVDYRPLRRRRWRRAVTQTACIAVSVFMAGPLVLIALAALSSANSLARFPKTLIPQQFSGQTLGSFLGTTGTIPAFGNSVLVGVYTVVLSLVVGAPAGYAVARMAFRGRDAYQVLILLIRALPVVVLAVPLASIFLRVGGYDTVFAVTLVHTALALPTTVLITASVFVAVPPDLEEAAQMLGCSRMQAARRIALPLALPGLTASAVFSFVVSWNDVLGAAVLTLSHRTLPAQVLTSLANSPEGYRFAGGFALVVPALLFILLMRRWLLNMWSSTLNA